MGFSTVAGTAAIDTDANFTPPTPDGSLCFWMRPTSVTGTNRVLGSASEYEVRLIGTQLFNDLGSGGPLELGSTAAITNNALYHVVLTYNIGVTTTQQIYLNGALDSSTASATATTPGAAILTFGNRTGSAVGDIFNGELYDIRIYNRVLTLKEVSTMYVLRGLDGIRSGLVYRWLFDEGAAGVAVSGAGVIKDHGPNHNNASTVTGAPTYIYSAGLRKRRKAA